MAMAVKRGSATTTLGGKETVRSMIEHRCKSAEACESHVSWLDGLRKEMSHFSHAVSSEAPVGLHSGQQAFGHKSGSVLDSDTYGLHSASSKSNSSSGNTSASYGKHSHSHYGP